MKRGLNIMSGLTTTSRSKTKPTPGDILLMTNFTNVELPEKKPEDELETITPRSLKKLELVMEHLKAQQDKTK